MATDCPGNDEIIVDGQNVLAFDVRDIEGGADAGWPLLADPKLRSQLADGARASIKGFPVDSMANQ